MSARDRAAARAAERGRGRAALSGPQVDGAGVDPAGPGRRSVTVHLGYGRTRAGRVGNGAGFNAYALRTATRRGSAPDSRSARPAAAIARHARSTTAAMEGREIVRAAHARRVPEQTRTSRKKERGAAQRADAVSRTCEVRRLRLGHGDRPERLHRLQRLRRRLPGGEQHPGGRQGAGARAAARCTGCASTAITKASSDNPEHVLPAGACMHCENAPCELVCPVQATVHSSEGLNDMVYNRCVGHALLLEQLPVQGAPLQLPAVSRTGHDRALKLLRNPDVTVRSRGVMEKCTYCVQRINARQDRSGESRTGRVRDGEIVTGLPAGLPDARRSCSATSTIPNSRVSKLKAEPRNYALLAELNTRPRTTYLAGLRNPNPEIGEGVASMAVDRTQRLVDQPTPTADAGRSRRATPSARVTDKISSIVLTRKTPLGWFLGFAIAFALLMLFLCGGQLPAVLQGVGIWGINIPVALGLRDRQLRLVDRYRPRRHADLRDPAAAAAGLAQRRSTASPKR